MSWQDTLIVVAGVCILAGAVAVTLLHRSWNEEQRATYGRRALPALIILPVVIVAAWWSAPRIVTDLAVLHAIEASVVLLATSWTVLAVIMWACLTPADERRKKHRRLIGDRVARAVLVLIGLFYGLLLVMFIAIPLGGPRQCRADIESSESLGFLHHGYHFHSALGTREYQDHWIVVMRAVPQDLADNTGSMLLVCHYETIGVFEHGHVQVLKPEQERHVRVVSRSPYRSWWPSKN